MVCAGIYVSGSCQWVLADAKNQGLLRMAMEYSAQKSNYRRVAIVSKISLKKCDVCGKPETYEHNDFARQGPNSWYVLKTMNPMDVGTDICSPGCLIAWADVASLELADMIDKLEKK